MEENKNNQGNQEKKNNQEHQENQRDYVEFDLKGNKAKFVGKVPARIAAIGAVAIVGTVAIAATLVITRNPEVTKVVAQNVIKLGVKAVA